MRGLLLSSIVAAVFFEVSGSPHSLALSCNPQSTEDSSLLRPTDVAYAEAMGFTSFLRDHGFKVDSVHRSKLEGFFQGVTKAAFFRTDRGIIEVIFFPDPTGAERVKATEQQKEGRYSYTFSGQPHPNPTSDLIDSAHPIYFVTHGSQFIVTHNRGIAGMLKRAFEQG